MSKIIEGLERKESGAMKLWEEKPAKEAALTNFWFLSLGGVRPTFTVLDFIIITFSMRFHIFSLPWTILNESQKNNQL